MAFDIVQVLERLPLRCYVGPSAAAKLAIGVGYHIDRGIPGYTPHPALTDDMAATLNAKYSVTPAQAEAMQVGSMFGWHVPGADPLTYA